MIENLIYDTFKDHKRVNFTVDGRESFIVCPDHPLPDKRWIWRAEFFGAFDTVDMALLERGWYLAFHRVSDMYGCPQSIEMMREFHNTVVTEFGLAPKTVLFGFSRGGLYSVNYAAAYPEITAELYLDAPVLDIRSWPGGKYSGTVTPSCWEECKTWYNLDEKSAEKFDGNPLNNAEKLASYNIPVIIVAGDADIDVPLSENSALFVPRYEKAGGNIKFIVKNGCAHHPHSLDDPTPVVKFIEENY